NIAAGAQPAVPGTIEQYGDHTPFSLEPVERARDDTRHLSVEAVERLRPIQLDAAKRALAENKNRSFKHIRHVVSVSSNVLFLTLGMTRPDFGSFRTIWSSRTTQAIRMLKQRLDAAES